MLNKKEFKELQLQYFVLTEKIKELEKIYKEQIKPYEEAFFASSMGDEEIDKLVRIDTTIRKKLKLKELEIKLIKIKDELIKQGIEYISSIATEKEKEKETIEYMQNNYKYHLDIADKLADIFSRMQV